MDHPYIPYNLTITEGKDLVKKVESDGNDYDFLLKDTNTEGSITVKVTDGYNKNPKTATITLKHNNCTGIKGESSISAYVGDGDINLGDYYKLISDYFTEADYDRVHAIEEEERNSDEWGGGGYSDTDPSHHSYLKSAQEETITSADPSIFEVLSPDMTEFSEENWGGRGLKEGETSITITCNGQSLTIPVTVKENHCKAIFIGEDSSYDYEYDDYEAATEDEDSAIRIYEASDEESDYDNANSITSLISLAGEDSKHPTTDQITSVTVADPSIVQVLHKTEDSYDEDTEEGWDAGWYITGLKEGDTTITVTCGSVTREMPITVEENY